MGAIIHEISSNAHNRVVGEMIHLDYAVDFTSIERFIERKTSLFNSTMIQLQLPYRFDYCWNIDTSIDRAIGAIMDSKTPPSSEWWRQNYLLLAYIPYDMAYASKDTLVQEYWPVLQAAYQLAQTISRSNKRPIPPEYSKDVEALFTNIYRVTQPTMYLHAHNSISSDSETISRSTATLLAEISKVLKSLNINYEGMCCE